MASHHSIVAIRPRTCATILSDIEEARRDYDDALTAEDADADDRATEAETRLDDLRDEFAERFEEACGLKLGDVLFAREQALI
jgi:hypothetical protein